MPLSSHPSGPVVLLLRIPCCPCSSVRALQGPCRLVSVRGTRTCHSSGSVPGDGTEAAHPAREHHCAIGPGSAWTRPPPSCPAHPQGCLEAGLPPGGRSASGRLLPLAGLSVPKPTELTAEAAAPAKPVPRRGHCHVTPGLSPKPWVRRTTAPRTSSSGSGPW